MRGLPAGLLLASLSALGAQSPGRLPWYMRETAMTPAGRLTFLDKPWWPRARQLREGASFTLDLNGDGRPDTLVERRDGNLVEAIDDSGHAHDILNIASTAYVVSYHATGIVDRMVVYIDNDGDGKADEMEIRYYRDGYLRFAWFGENHDPDGERIFALSNWTYAGNNAASKFRGNVEIYLNKYDSSTQSWLPLSECPFAFWDPNHDGLSERVVRISVAPLDSNSGPDLDYANNYDYMWSPEATPLAKLGDMNVRLSYNIDPEPRPGPVTRPHYNFGFTLVGAAPYRYPDMFYTNPRRRPPQTVVRIPWTGATAAALDYPAQKTGFTWDEARGVYRWEGQFWIYERDVLPNTGGPTNRWNMRREFSDRPATHRQLYYSDVDKRFHLYGAREGWMEAGHLVNDRKDLEFRFFDRDGDGYLDTWEVFAGDSAAPVRVSAVAPRARMVTPSREAMAEMYNRKILPEAIADDEQLIAAMKRVAHSPLAAQYEQEAQKADMPERRRYCLDIARELYFLAARDTLYQRAGAGDYPRLEQPAPRHTLAPGPADSGYTVGDTLAFWQRARRTDDFVALYGEGRLKEAAAALAEIASLP